MQPSLISWSDLCWLKDVCDKKKKNTSEEYVETILPTPISRNELCRLKDNWISEARIYEEKKRKEYVDSIVEMIYSAAIKQARITPDDVFQFDLPNYYYQALDANKYFTPISAVADPYISNGQYTQTMKDIISKLKHLFPDCSHNNGWKKDAKDRWIYYIIIKWS